MINATFKARAPYKISSLALLVSAILSLPALAQTADGAKMPAASGVTASMAEKNDDMRQFSQAGHLAMMNIGDARLAIFNGDPKSAMKLMQSAKTLLAQADAEAPSMAAPATGSKARPGTVNTKMRNVSVDGQITLADDYVMTPEKKAHIDKANESFKNGDHANGLEELRLGAIDVNYTRWWLPIAPTETHLDQAIRLADESKYYEANIALKAIEDSVTMDSISFSDLPTPPTAPKSAKASS